MTLKDILSLPKQEESLDIIKEYLNQSISLADYQVAFIMLLDMGNDLGYHENVLEEGEYLLLQMDKQRDSINYEALLRVLVDASLALELFTRTKEYILKRKEALPIIRQYLYILDEIKLKKKMGEPYEEEINKALADVLPNKIKLDLLIDYFDITKKREDYQKSLELIEQILIIDPNNMIFEEKLRIFVLLKYFDEAKELALAAYSKPSLKPIAFITLIKVYIEEENYHKAVILDAENEDFIETLADDYKRDIYILMIELYERLENKLSLDNYKKKLNKLTKKEAKQDVLEIPITPSIKKEQIPPKKDIVKSQKKAFSDFAEALDTANELLIYSHQLSQNLPFREFLRIFFISLEKALPLKECYLYLNDENINFFHYKIERLYDKRLYNELLFNTVIEHVLTTLDEVVEETSRIRFTKNPITQKGYTEEIKSLIAIPIADIGVFVVHFDGNVSDATKYYDLVKLVSSIIYTKIIDEKQLESFKAEKDFLNSILKKDFIPVRIQSEYYATYNDLAQKLFDCDIHFNINEFYNFIAHANMHEYKALIRRLFVKTNESFEIIYNFKEKIIKEKLISINDKLEVKIISIFEDITDAVSLQNELKTRSLVDYETSLNNIFALEEKMDEYFNEKVSFVMVRLNKDLDMIYGSEKAKEFFSEFARATKKYFIDGETYRYNEDTLIIIIPSNDIRKVTKIVKDYVRDIKEIPSQIIKYEHFDAYLGVLRYPVVTVERNPKKIYRFLSIALNNAILGSEDNISFFNYADYEEDVFEIQVIDYINKAIESNNLSLNFNQITDILNKKIWQYESELSIPNLKIDSKYLLTIAKKRNRLLELERHHIILVVKFLKDLAITTNRLIKITIPISKQTFIDPTFNTFFVGLLKKEQIDYGFIRLKIDGYIKQSLTKGIYELRDYGIGVDTNDIEMVLSHSLDGFHYDLKNLDEKHQMFLSLLNEMLAKKNIALVIRNVKTKEIREELAKQNIRYVSGEIYKQIKDKELFNKIKEAYEGN